MLLLELNKTESTKKIKLSQIDQSLLKMGIKLLIPQPVKKDS